MKLTLPVATVATLFFASSAYARCQPCFGGEKWFTLRGDSWPEEINPKNQIVLSITGDLHTNDVNGNCEVEFAAAAKSKNEMKWKVSLAGAVAPDISLPFVQSTDKDIKFATFLPPDLASLGAPSDVQLTVKVSCTVNGNREPSRVLCVKGKIRTI
ncbi:hypothetical protein BGZ70_004663 [Mortierella alpina]|uniref:Uncharacterized protein n=1 Tax=Mortierella alpina TaxID=64518 RepID=A0A9P6J9X0_MORAP|nr:hypothetical protein BGZ70_004663 [Mortierella alpina]